MEVYIVNGIPIFVIAAFVVAQNLFQHSKHLCNHGIHVLHYQLQCHQYTRGFVFTKLILEAHKSKIDWLRSFGCNRDPAEIKDSNCYF